MDGHDGIHARNMVCHLISALASRGWIAVTAADVSSKYVHKDNGPYYPIDVDSIFFLYDPSAVAAAPTAPPLQLPYPQLYPQPFTQPYPQPFPQPYPPPAAYGFAQQGAPPPFDPPAYGAFSNQ